MPSLYTYKHMHHAPNMNGLHRKLNSDMLENASWWEDIDSRVVYLYDFYHDNEPLKLRDIHPENNELAVAIDAKYIQNAHQTMSKDQVPFHLQLRPGQTCNVNYYDEVFGERYHAIFPVGLYCAIPDNNGQFNKWLVVAKADYYSPQFSTFEVLPCDYVLQWMMNGKKMEMAGVLQSQNSYNAGVWLNNIIQSPEDQQKILLPLNRDSEKLYYDQRLIIDNCVLTEPRTWSISKVNRISSNGLVLITTAQTTFNRHTDFIEKDNNGNVIGLWADFFTEDIPQPEPSNDEDIPTITFSGLKPEVKVNGSYKKLTVSDDGNGSWDFKIADTDVSHLINILTSSESTDVNDNQIKIKFMGGSEYIGSILLIEYTNSIGTATLRLGIVGL